MAKNPLELVTIRASSEPDAIENMPGYVPPKQRKAWTLAEHCDFANRQLEWRGINEARIARGEGPVRWIVNNKRVELTVA